MSVWRIARRTAIASCSIGGLVLAGPLTWAWLTHSTTRSAILEVLTTPVADGTRLSLFFDLEVPAASGRLHVLGWHVADDWCRPGDDPVFDAEEAARAIAAWRPRDGRHAVGRTFYRANDPAGTAFILPPGHPAERRQLVGLLLVLGALVLTLIRTPR